MDSRGAMYHGEIGIIVAHIPSGEVKVVEAG
jgi:hypothetical protein